MTMREKLIELLREAIHYHDEQVEKWIIRGKQCERPTIIYDFADYLIAHGVTIKEHEEIDFDYAAEDD